MRHYDRLTLALWRFSHPAVRFFTLGAGLLFSVALLSGLGVSCSGDGGRAMHQEVADLVRRGEISAELGKLDGLIDAHNAPPAWLVTGGTVLGSLVASFLGIKTAKNGMAKALEEAQSLAASAHAKIADLTKASPAEGDQSKRG